MQKFFDIHLIDWREKNEICRHDKKKKLRAELRGAENGFPKSYKKQNDAVFKLKIRKLDKQLKGFRYLCNKENIEFTLVGSSLKPLVRAGIPKRKLIALFLNILDNARQACKFSNDKRKKIFCEVRVAKGNVIIIFCDSGLPMSDSVFQKIGKIYNTDRGKIGGSGIGLYSVKQIVEEFDGIVDFSGLTQEINKHLFIRFNLQSVRSFSKRKWLRF